MEEKTEHDAARPFKLTIPGYRRMSPPRESFHATLIDALVFAGERSDAIVRDMRTGEERSVSEWKQKGS